MLRHISVDITNILAFQFNAAGGCDVYGKVVELMDDQVQVHGGRGADGPYGNGLPLLGIGEGETVVTRPPVRFSLAVDRLSSEMPMDLRVSRISST